MLLGTRVAEVALPPSSMHEPGSKAVQIRVRLNWANCRAGMAPQEVCALEAQPGMSKVDSSTAQVVGRGKHGSIKERVILVGARDIGQCGRACNPPDKISSIVRYLSFV